MDLVFRAANRATVDLLHDTGDVARDWQYGDRAVIRARFPWDAKMPCHFDDDIYDIYD